jgi:hypothetical protein
MEERKFIEENHNGGPYSKEQCIDFCERLVSILTSSWDKGNDQFIKDFWKWKKKIQDLILHWNPELSITEYPGYGFLKFALESYWDYYVRDKDKEKFYEEIGKYDK